MTKQASKIKHTGLFTESFKPDLSGYDTETQAKMLDWVQKNRVRKIHQDTAPPVKDQVKKAKSLASETDSRIDIEEANKPRPVHNVSRETYSPQELRHEYHMYLMESDEEETKEVLEALTAYEMPSETECPYVRIAGHVAFKQKYTEFIRDAKTWHDIKYDWVQTCLMNLYEAIALWDTEGEREYLARLHTVRESYTGLYNIPDGEYLADMDELNKAHYLYKNTLRLSLVYARTTLFRGNADIQKVMKIKQESIFTYYKERDQFGDLRTYKRDQEGNVSRVTDNQDSYLDAVSDMIEALERGLDSYSDCILKVDLEQNAGLTPKQWAKVQAVLGGEYKRHVGTSRDWQTIEKKIRKVI